MNNLSKILLLGPEVLPVDFSMREPKRAVMRMVVFFIRGGLHRPVSCHRGFPGPHQRIEIGARNVLKEILRKEVAVDLDVKPVWQLRDSYSLACGRGLIGCGRTIGGTTGADHHGQAKKKRG